MRFHRKGAATTEYIIILTLVLAIILALFWRTIVEQLEQKIEDLAPGVLTQPKEKSGKTKKGKGSGSTSPDEGGGWSGGGGSGGTTGPGSGGFEPIDSTGSVKHL